MIMLTVSTEVKEIPSRLRVTPVIYTRAIFITYECLSLRVEDEAKTNVERCNGISSSQA